MEKLEFKGTKGEWMFAITGSVRGGDIYQVVADVPYSGIMGGDSETPICNVTRYGSVEQSKADAKLIAAAPDLLKALQEVLNHTPIGHDFFTEGESIAIINAEKAITKALK